MAGGQRQNRCFAALRMTMSGSFIAPGVILSNAKDLISTANMLQKTYYVYILTTWNHRVMYVGVTNNLTRRLYEHKNELIDGFTKRYHVHKLVYYESTGDTVSAIARE